MTDYICPFCKKNETELDKAGSPLLCIPCAILMEARDKMTHSDLKDVLSSLESGALFTPTEVHRIVQLCGKATVGSAVIACEVLDIKLSWTDIDEMISAARMKEAYGPTT